MMRRCLMLVCILACAIDGGCSSPATPELPSTVVGGYHSYDCGFWYPDAPAVSRALMDVAVAGEFGPEAASIAALEAAGAKTVYRFHTGIVRVELDVALVDTLYRAPKPVLFSAATAPNPASHTVLIFAFFDRLVTDADAAALAALGASNINYYTFSSSISAYIDDAKIPQVRALPGVQHASNGVRDCVAASVR